MHTSLRLPRDSLAMGWSSTTRRLSFGIIYRKALWSHKKSKQENRLLQRTGMHPQFRKTVVKVETCWLPVKHWMDRKRNLAAKALGKSKIGLWSVL